MSFWRALFSADKAVDNVLDNEKGLVVRAGKWVDNLNYTDEEKAKMALEYARVGAERLKALEPFKVVQRILAFGVAFLWAVVGMNCLGAIWYDAVFECRYVTDQTGVVTVVNCIPVTPEMLKFAFSDFVLWPVTVVFGLYFGGGLLNSIRGEKK